MEHEASTNSTDPDERIRFRQQRVEQRNASKDDEKSKKKRAEPEAKQMSRGQKQISESLSNLDKAKVMGIDDVTLIRVEADNKENRRRILEEERRQDRLRRLQDEAVQSGKRNAAVEMRWAELLDYNMPQDLLNEINSQKRDCQVIIDSKDKMIKEFQQQLKMKDEEYVKSLKRQAEDIENLLEKMSQQFREMQEEYEVELDTIEAAFLEEREALMNSNKDEIDKLFDKRREMEMKYMEDKQQREEQYQQEIEALRIKDGENYNKLKIKLETDIQTLEQQLEEMRATYQLNTEKLEYNYRVLTERDMENNATLAQQKRKWTRLKDVLSNLMQKYHKTEARDRQQNHELTEEYRRITKQYKDLQTKFRHFEVVDNRKYQDVWNMHQEEVSSLVDQVLQADKIIHEQLLDLEWVAPTEDPFTMLQNGLTTKQFADTAGSEGNDDESNNGETSAPSGPHSLLQGKNPQVSVGKVRMMLELLASEAGFLVDAKVQSALPGMSAEEQSVMKADSILRSLGVTTEEDVAKLMTYFYKEEGPVGSELDSDDGFAQKSQQRAPAMDLKVGPDDVIRVVKQFIEDRQEDAGVTGVNLSAMRDAADDALNDQGDQTNGSSGMPGGSTRASKHDQLMAVWDQASTVISDKGDRVWKALEKGLQKYNDVLLERAELIDDVADLKGQNDELKGLLSQYLGAQVNDELLIPPTQLIRVDAPRKR